MKFKPTSQGGGLVAELSPRERQIPQPTAPNVFSLKHILVPVDYSECSDKALQYASALAKQFGAKITVLHVTQPFVQVPDLVVVDVDLLHKQMQESARKELASTQRQIDPEIISHAIVRSGEASREIVEVAKEEETDLIVIGTHGRTGLKHVFLGSVAERVVRYANCPVLVVREKEHDFVEG